MTPAVAASAHEIAESIDRAWRGFLERDTHARTPHPYVYASSFRACDRRAVYEMTIPDQQPPLPADVLARFRRGDDRERDLLADLSRIGREAEPSFKVIGQQERFVLRDRKGREVIHGKVDARLEVDGRRPPLEVKAWSPFLVDRIERFADLFENPWTKAGAYQLLSYLFGAAEPYGFMLLDRSGLPKLIPVELGDPANLDRMEAFLTKAERFSSSGRTSTRLELKMCSRCVRVSPRSRDGFSSRLLLVAPMPPSPPASETVPMVRDQVYEAWNWEPRPKRLTSCVCSEW